MKVGLFFGSFNPIHMGHMIVAQVLRELTDIQEIWFIVSPQNPFKRNNNLLHEFDRLDMVRAAIQDDYHFKASDIEFNMPRPSYTIDTLTYLSDKYPSHQFRLIIGQDNLKSFHKWKNHEKILENFGLLVYPRPNSEPADRDYPNMRLVEAPEIDISATLIRRMIKEGKSPKYLIPDPVINLINAKKFYQ